MTPERFSDILSNRGINGLLTGRLPPRPDGNHTTHTDNITLGQAGTDKTGRLSSDFNSKSTTRRSNGRGSHATEGWANQSRDEPTPDELDCTGLVHGSERSATRDAVVAWVAKMMPPAGSSFSTWRSMPTGPANTSVSVPLPEA